MMAFLEIASGVIASAILAGGVLALAGLGETLSQRVGVFNLGVEGYLGMGGITAIATVAQTGSLSLACLAAALVGVLLGAVFATATVVVRANQVTCGLAFAFLGLGLSAWIGNAYSGQPAAASFGRIAIPWLSDIPYLGRALFNHPLPVYVTYLVLPVALHMMLFRTRHGINLRAVGENPAAAEATGIPVMRLRGLYVIAGGVLASLAGAYLTLVFVPSWSEGITAGRGWIAISLVIFAGYRPYRVVGGAILFGLVTSFGYVGQARGWPVPSAFFSALPYLATLILLLPLIRGRRPNPLTRAPAALGQPYYRDER